MNLTQLASRYERIIYERSNSLQDYLDTARLGDRIQYLLQNDSPTALVEELFSFPSCSPTTVFPRSNDPLEAARTNAEDPHNTAAVSRRARLVSNPPIPMLSPDDWPKPSGARFPVSHCGIRSASNGLDLSSRYLKMVATVAIRRKQKRLLDLYHSAQCKHDDTIYGPCRSSSSCSLMKRLWRHLSTCIDDRCTVPHCFSSRTVLGHYHRCKNDSCTICAPVRCQLTNRKEDEVAEHWNPTRQDFQSDMHGRTSGDTLKISYHLAPPLPSSITMCNAPLNTIVDAETSGNNGKSQLGLGTIAEEEHVGESKFDPIGDKAMASDTSKESSNLASSDTQESSTSCRPSSSKSSSMNDNSVQNSEPIDSMDIAVFLSSLQTKNSGVPKPEGRMSRRVSENGSVANDVVKMNEL